MKSLAIKNINEFLYGIRACRQRQKPDGTLEAEPIVYIFWKVRVHVRARIHVQRTHTRIRPALSRAPFAAPTHGILTHAILGCSKCRVASLVAVLWYSVAVV